MFEGKEVSRSSVSHFLAALTSLSAACKLADCRLWCVKHKQNKGPRKGAPGVRNSGRTFRCTSIGGCTTGLCSLDQMRRQVTRVALMR
jgi:hypothetical protein